VFRSVTVKIYDNYAQKKRNIEDVDCFKIFGNSYCNQQAILRAFRSMETDVSNLVVLLAFVTYLGIAREVLLGHVLGSA
jgi:hypothetical protein